MSASLHHADGPPDIVNPTSAEETIYNRGNGLIATVSATGSQASDSSTYDSYLHCTCPGCHHWLNKISIKLSKNRRKHERFQCPRCQHLLFGLGGNSTQTTLASQETISRRESGASAAESSSRFHGCTDVRSLEPSRDRNLRTIVEASPSNGVSREPSQRSAPPREQSQPAKQLPQEQPPVLDTNDSGQGLSAAVRGKRGELHPEKTATVLSASGRFKKIKDHADRVLRKVKSIKNRIRKPSNTGLGPFTKDQTAKVTANANAATLGKEISSTSKPTTVNPSIPSHGQQMSEQPLNEQGSFAAVLNARFNSIHGEPHENRVESSEEEITAADEKRERIRWRRREKTLRVEALHKPKCECTDGCQCMQRETASRSSGDGQSRALHPADIEPHRFPQGIQSPEGSRTSSTIDSRRVSSDVSSEGRQQSPHPGDFVGIGYRFSHSWHGSSQGVGGRVRPLSSLSQAPTAVSNNSSISLLSGPAYISRRPPSSRPQTPTLQVNVDGGVDEDEDSGGPTPTQHDIASRWTPPSAEDERPANTSPTLVDVIEDEIHDRSLVDHDGALLPRSEDAE